VIFGCTLAAEATDAVQTHEAQVGLGLVDLLLFALEFGPLAPPLLFAAHALLEQAVLRALVLHEAALLALEE